ncbi:DUF2384 domain-containing protein [Dyella amyloliquefaciens]|uniref:DUF2384 domain-containing protein n=1 Tax=Dyella amyloliquefaciens TaxID=1770545 RepID=UPI00102E5A6B|nr:DUF2384 domain-containing protein [Dyella amyloliquefaciens]
MINAQTALRGIASEVAQANALRDKITLSSFMALEDLYPQLADLLVQQIGSRRRAAQWMCRHQWSFAGRTAYEVLAEGDESRLWDVIHDASPNLYSRDLVGE